MPLAKGTRLGRYEIVGWIGAGAMGEVYRAHDPVLDRDVAVKVIPAALAADAGRVRRFEQEARAAGRISHPNILAVHDVGVYDGGLYIVSELLEGSSLRNHLGGRPLPVRTAIDYARQIAAGLAAAHDKHLVHRDVKPENLFLTTDGRITILDFGLAKLTRPEEDSSPRASTETSPGVVVGTSAYMSPEQTRGETVDPRSDLFSLGSVLYEMLAGSSAFARPTPADTMAAVLRETPALPADVPPALARIVERCLEKLPENRFQSARDLAFALNVLTETGPAPGPQAKGMSRQVRWRAPLLVMAVLLVTGVLWWTADPPAPDSDPLSNARFRRLTDWDGTETMAEISPDGKFAVFLSDRAGEFDIWLGQIDTGEFRNLTADIGPMSPAGFVLRNFGVTGDGAEIWFSATGRPGDPKLLMPLLGGKARPFLGSGDATPSWSPDGSKVVYFNNKEDGGDPLFIADGAGGNARLLLPPEEAVRHNHNPVWSPDGRWIFFVRGGADPSAAMDIWRIPSSGGIPDRLTDRQQPLNYLAAIDARTLLYPSRTDDGTGPWLWALDVATRTSRRASAGLDVFTSVAASRDGRRVVTTVADPVSGLWSVPILDGPGAGERLVQRHVDFAAAAPRFGGSSLFHLGGRSPRTLRRLRNGDSEEIWKGLDGQVADPPAVSKDGLRVAVTVTVTGRRRLAVMSADGTSFRTLPAALEVESAPGAAAADWSPDGRWLVAGGRDAQGPGLFKIPVDGSEAIRLVEGHALNPIWSPDGQLIVYGGRFVNGQVPILAVRPDGTPVPLPPLYAREGAYRFLPDSRGLVFLPMVRSNDFHLLDFASGEARQLTRLDDRGRLSGFDIAPDGRSIVFERVRENSDIVLIELPR